MDDLKSIALQNQAVASTENDRSDGVDSLNKVGVTLFDALIQAEGINR